MQPVPLQQNRSKQTAIRRERNEEEEKRERKEKQKLREKRGKLFKKIQDKPWPLLAACIRLTCNSLPCWKQSKIIPQWVDGDYSAVGSGRPHACEIDSTPRLAIWPSTYRGPCTVWSFGVWCADLETASSAVGDLRPLPSTRTCLWRWPEIFYDFFLQLLLVILNIFQSKLNNPQSRLGIFEIKINSSQSNRAPSN